MALDTYANLSAAIADWLDRPDLTAQIDDFIDLAEARHAVDIRIDDMLNINKSFSIGANVREVALPATCLDVKAFRLVIPNVTTGRRYYPDFDFVSIDQMTDVSSNDTFRPTVYTIRAGQIEFDVETDQAYTGELVYYEAYTPLSVGSPTNNLLTTSPGVYLYGALAASAPFLLNDERVELWESLYARERDSLNGSDIQALLPGRLRTQLQNIPSRWSR